MSGDQAARAAEEAATVLASNVTGDRSEPAVSRRPIPPSLAERYEDIRFLGEGGMGTVYRAVDPRLGRTVAVKLLKGMDAELCRRFLAEARAQARIVHEHVCRVYEAGQVDGEPYIAMQYIDGEPLSKLKDNLRLEQRVKVMQEIAAAVHEAHRLGIIHRDIKPSNVLCEQREDGSLKPYIMDFGLAREVEDQGHTQTGAVLGTPAYMPPEQARGDVRAMDRRSDVYSLGATLYDLIAGHPPFVSDHPWNLLMAVAYEEAPPLGNAKQGVPPDLETVVMKCLEREPSRRYESARALAEDLQRYLDGDPIQAKRAFLGYVLWKKAKKHKLWATFMASMLLTALALGGVWVRARRQATEQARLAQQLGEGVKEMELFLRAAYELPLHDVERERDVVRARLGEIEQKMQAAGKAGDGPGHYALGRGYLALGDPELAREHLEKALSAGYASADLEYALGRALGELFRRAVDETKRMTNEDERKKKVEALEKELRDPALAHLRAAVQAKIEVPAYAEGLIALHEGKNEEALKKAKEAFEKAPWMYEAKKLEGDALYAEGSKYRHDAAFDYEKMIAYFEPASKAYELAADMGRSDPDVHRASCELGEKTGWATWMKGLPFQPSFTDAIAACERSMQSSMRDKKASVLRAIVLAANVFAIADSPSEDAMRIADQAVRAAEEAVKVSPLDVEAHYAMAEALYHRTNILLALDREASMTQAINAYERVLKMDPRFTWAMNALGNAYLDEAGSLILRGQDAAELIRSAIRQFDQAIVVDPKYALPAGRKLHAYKLMVESQLERGRDASEPLRALLDTVSQAESMGSGPWLVAFWTARAHRLKAQHEQAFGRDPLPALDAAEHTIAAAQRSAPNDYWFWLELAYCKALRVHHAIDAGLDETSTLMEAKNAIEQAARARAPEPPDLRFVSARIAMEAIRAARTREKVTPAMFDAALKPLEPLLSSKSADPTPYILAAQAHALRASWRAEHGEALGDDLSRGLALVDLALKRNPNLATAFATQGRLLLLEAQSLQATPTRSATAKKAKESFDTAFRHCPLLMKAEATSLKEVEALLREKG